MLRTQTILALLLAALVPACSVTLREPVVQPLDPSRIYATDLEPVCDALEATLAGLGLTIANTVAERTACLSETEHLRLSDTGDAINHLDEVAYVGNQNFFSHGRYLLAVSARPGPQGVSVRVTSRIEGYDAGYRLLRSTGLIEQTFFDRLSEQLATEPIGD